MAGQVTLATIKAAFGAYTWGITLMYGENGELHDTPVQDGCTDLYKKQCVADKEEIQKMLIEGEGEMTCVGSMGCTLKRVKYEKGEVIFKEEVGVSTGKSVRKEYNIF